MILLVVLAFALVLVLVGLLQHVMKQKTNIPWAKGSVPILGHALAYKRCPPEFLRKQKKMLGNVFRIKLAGKTFVVVPPSRRVLCASEREVSARRAYASIGFEESMGRNNVHVGPDFHKQIIKQGVPTISLESIDNALGKIDGELFDVLRRSMLRLVVDSYFGKDFVRAVSSGFVDEFLDFQNKIETGIAAALPRPLALVFSLWPVAAARRKLEDGIKEGVLIGDGPWPKAFRAHGLSREDAANLTIGILFASHSNQPIAAAQTFLYLRDNVEARREACAVVDGQISLGQAKTIHAGCLETLRLVSLPLGSIREVCVDRLEVAGGVYVTRGESIAVSHSLANTDPAVWGPDALEFDINRPLGLLETRINTFSGGTHQCPGRQLAMELVEATVAVLLHRLHRGEIALDVAADNLPPLSFDRATLARRAGPVLISSSKRASSSSTNGAPSGPK